MKIKSFRIKNYKSIIDSGECRLSDHDNITVLAGQNESGKSSILQALRDFEVKKLDVNCFRDDDSLPEICINFTVDKDEIDLDSMNLDIPDSCKEVLRNINEFKVTRFFSAENVCKTTYTVANEIISKIEEVLLLDNAIGNLSYKTNLSGLVQEVLQEKKNSATDIVNTFLIECFLYTPTIIFFDDFCDLLPDSIPISALVGKKIQTKGYQAVKNIETILNTDFTQLVGIADGRRQRMQSAYHETISANFNEKWKQRIADEDGAEIHIIYNQGEAANAAYLTFFIATKKGEFLPAGKRSQGFKWFLSFYLHLRAEHVRSKELVILFDEPGLYLHSKAQRDMIAVFEELSAENQIIYSTHSPYLIDSKKLHRLRLILNTKSNGTTIEKITSKKIKNQKDALKPIIDAVGLEIAPPFSVAMKNNIILEGISDFHYMQGMKILLEKNYDLGMLPSMGAANCHLLMELCIGWGLDWVMIFDNKGTTKAYNYIKKEFFDNNDDRAGEKIFRIDNCDGIEDIFTVGDMKIIIPEGDFSGDRKNSDAVNDCGGKELCSRIFYEKVSTGQILKDNLSKTSIKKFEGIFAFIEQKLDL